ncbi:MBL fold metallo-hydrolase [Stutzerimonas frequens]|uniref:MBL fold metallo-hydrolase n=1 Tax=Stutzerimonas frequens TaxID=2968969 RepID=UPI000D7D49DC|nr:MBL fold metallo-hydrolase [Stutzerimonas frequens]AWT11165.1 MBL fold metallo-hydrolase [Stutzerimonas frequens]
MTDTGPTLIRETFPVGPLQCNCTIIGDPLSKKAIVVDPGGDPELIMARLQCRLFGVPYTPVPAPDRWLADDEELACGCGVALHTPGHTPGSMSFWFADAKLLIAGDTLFRRGIGRTDLWGGDYAAIERSIRQRLYTLDEEATVVTGHGPDTQLGDEMRENPFVRG